MAYAIDRIMANCSIIPIMNASFDTSINVSVAANKQQFVIKMKSPQDLFYIDNNYTYAGQVTMGFWYISYFRWLYLHVIAINQSFTALAMKFMFLPKRRQFCEMHLSDLLQKTMTS